MVNANAPITPSIEKDANQDPSTLYKANYDKCKKSLNQNPDETSLSEDVFGSGEDLDSILGER
jgi:hypothetical protein